MQKKKKFNPHFVPNTKINPKWVIDQNSNIMKLLEENTGEKLLPWFR